MPHDMLTAINHGCDKNKIKEAVLKQTDLPVFLPRHLEKGKDRQREVTSDLIMKVTGADRMLPEPQLPRRDRIQSLMQMIESHVV